MVLISYLLKHFNYLKYIFYHIINISVTNYNLYTFRNNLNNSTHFYCYMHDILIRTFKRFLFGKFQQIEIISVEVIN